MNNPFDGKQDKEIARNFILFGKPDVTVIVVDAGRLERNLNFVLQVLEITNQAVLCLNLIDEAKRHLGNYLRTNTAIHCYISHYGFVHIPIKFAEKLSCVGRIPFTVSLAFWSGARTTVEKKKRHR